MQSYKNSESITIQRKEFPQLRITTHNLSKEQDLTEEATSPLNPIIEQLLSKMQQKHFNICKQFDDEAREYEKTKQMYASLVEEKKQLCKKYEEKIRTLQSNIEETKLKEDKAKTFLIKSRDELAQQVASLSKHKQEIASQLASALDKEQITLTKVQTLRVENEQLQRKLANTALQVTFPKDKIFDQVKLEKLEQMTRADEAILDLKKIMTLYEKALKDLIETKKELATTQEENNNLKKVINESNIPKPTLILKSVGGFFQTKINTPKAEAKSNDSATMLRI